MFTALVITGPKMPSETHASTVMSSSAHRLTAEMSVGLNAVAVQKGQRQVADKLGHSGGRHVAGVQYFWEDERRVRVGWCAWAAAPPPSRSQYHSPNAITFVAQMTSPVASSPVALFAKTLLLVRMSVTSRAAANRFAAVMNAMTMPVMIYRRLTA